MKTLPITKAVKLVNAATFTISDLNRAQRKDLVTLALRKVVEANGSKKLEGKP